MSLRCAMATQTKRNAKLVSVCKSKHTHMRMSIHITAPEGKRCVSPRPARSTFCNSLSKKLNARAETGCMPLYNIPRTRGVLNSFATRRDAF